jgi:hypothetical protein
MMKKTVVTVVALCSLAMAGNYTKQDRMNDMNQMAEAMNMIQSGFFYNNYDTVTKGVTKLTEAIVRVKPPLEEQEEKNPMTRYMNQKVQMTNKIVKKINQKGLTILQRFKDGDTEQAVQAYTKVMKQCMKCHREIRQW